MKLPIPQIHFYDPDYPCVYSKAKVLQILSNQYPQYKFDSDSLKTFMSQSCVSFARYAVNVTRGDEIIVNPEMELLSRRWLPYNDFQKLIDFIESGNYVPPVPIDTKLLGNPERQNEWAQSWLGQNIPNWRGRELNNAEMESFRNAASKVGLKGKTFKRVRARIDVKGKNNAN